MFSPFLDIIFYHCISLCFLPKIDDFVCFFNWHLIFIFQNLTKTIHWSLFFSSNTNFNMELCQRGKCWRDTLFCIWKVNASCGATRSRIFKIRFLRPGNCTRLPEVANCNDYTVIALCNFTIYMSWSAQIW